MAHHNLPLIFGSDVKPKTHTVKAVVIAGWAGRDPVAVEKHIKELEALGVKRPTSTPIFYRVAASRLATDTEIEVSGADSGGEVEFILLRQGGKLWVGVGSDHTDRKVEAYGVTVSKQMCQKPIAAQFWAYDDVASHWDKLMLRSYVFENSQRTLYQEGPVTGLLHPEALISRYNEGGGVLNKSTLMFGGTLAAKGGVRPTAQFAFEIEDPVLGRKISHEYKVVTLPVLG